jgi:hypothetical protein
MHDVLLLEQIPIPTHMDHDDVQIHALGRRTVVNKLLIIFLCRIRCGLVITNHGNRRRETGWCLWVIGLTDDLQRFDRCN